LADPVYESGLCLPVLLGEGTGVPTGQDRPEGNLGRSTQPRVIRIDHVGHEPHRRQVPGNALGHIYLDTRHSGPPSVVVCFVRENRPELAGLLILIRVSTEIKETTVVRNRPDDRNLRYACRANSQLNSAKIC
jgi:hypothetical protein